MNELLHVSSAPHVRAKASTSKVMLMVIIALLPTTAFGIYNFGIRALLLLLVTVASCVVSELLFNMIMKQKRTIDDLSAVVTGMILALNMPVSLPYWEAILGGVFAIVVVKMLFGGLGQNFMNPALAARCFLLIAFAGDMSNFKTELYSGATPLVDIALFKGNMRLCDFDLMDLFIGKHGGTIGETSALCLLIGLVILVVTKTISLRIPVAYLGSFAVFMALLGPGGDDVGTYVLAELLAGGIMFGAIFMATDYATTPITRLGQIIFGICCGVLTGIFRLYGGSPEGVSYAIIISNLLVPLIEKITVPKAFGMKKAVKEAK